MSETVFAYRYGFIGAGAMAEAIVSGMVQSGLCRGTDIVMSNRSAEKLERMHAQYGVAVASDNSLVMQQAEYIVLAVKPQQFPTMCEALQCKPGSRQTVVSIMAGLSIAAIEESGAHRRREVQEMPLPALWTFLPLSTQRLHRRSIIRECSRSPRPSLQAGRSSRPWACRITSGT